MTVQFRQAEPGDLDPLIDRDLQAFAGTATADERATWRELLDLDRFRVAYDGDDLVGAAGSLELELTLPGGAIVPMGGTTWVSVAPTHRRRGVVTRLMDDVHTDIDERGEPVAGLVASEGAIYERFGYGIATRRRLVEMDTREARIVDPPGDALRMVVPNDHVDDLWERVERYRGGRAGEVSQTREWLAMRIAELKHPFCVLHEDGYALWTVDANWGGGEPAHTLRVHDLVASTPQSSASLWNLLLSVDLVRTVVAPSPVALDDQLPYLLSDQRAVRTRAVHDFLWLRPSRVGELLAARRYRIDDELVVEVVDGDSVSDVERWRVSGGPDGAVCDATDSEPVLSMSRAALGSLMLGGVSATELAAGGRLRSTVRDLGRADAFFGWSPVPHCTVSF